MLDLFAAVPVHDDDVIVWKLSFPDSDRTAGIGGRVVTYERLIGPAVIVPLKLQILVPACDRAREPQSDLHDLRSAVGVRNEIGAGNDLCQQFGDLEFEVVLRSEGE